MIKSFRKLAVAGFLATSPLVANAAVLTFESIGDQTPVDTFYNGIGVYVDENAYAIEDFSAGGTYAPVTGNPSGVGALLYANDPNYGPGAMYVDGSFNLSSFGFYYSNPNGVAASVHVQDPLGNDLATIVLGSTAAGDPFTSWAWASAEGYGEGAYIYFDSIDPYNVAYDDITFTEYNGDPAPQEGNPVPEPSTVIGGLALGSLIARRAFRKA